MGKDHLAPLLPNHTYHLYNRAPGSEKLFLSKENYRFFLEKFLQYTQPFCDIYCYSLLPNHFHFLIRIKPEDRFTHLSPPLQENIPSFISQKFSNLFNAYTKSFNELYGRKGSLFMRPYKRIQVEKDAYFSKLVHYIHANPVHHSICRTITEWEHSSFHSLTNAESTILLRNEVLDFFGGLKQFIQFHEQPIQPKLEIDYE